MKSITLPMTGLVLMLALTALVVVVDMTTGSRSLVWVVGFALALVAAGGLRLRLQRGAAELNGLLRALPQEPVKDLALVDLPDTVEALREASARLQRQFGASEDDRQQLVSLLDSMQDAVVAVDGAGRIQWTNQRMQRVLPRAAAGMETNGVRVGHALVQTIRDPEVLACVRMALEERQVSTGRTTTLLPGRTFEVNASPMHAGGAVAVLHDVTRVEEMERTQRDFVANVSHELRTPLTSISGYVETLLDHEAGISAQGREFLTTILKNTMRMNRLTEDLLVMARVEAPGGAPNPAPVPADVLIRDAVRGIHGMTQENGAVLEVESATDCQVFADSDAVMQVMGNLIENAVKYGRPRGGGPVRVVLNAREVHVPYEAVEFSVRDFGPGIGSEHLPRLFERFYRVDKTRSRESGGTGLGLTIARHMVQAQGGEIWAESELNEGTVFRFTLPKALEPVDREQFYG